MSGFKGYRNWENREFSLAAIQSGFYAFGGIPGYTRFQHTPDPPPCYLCKRIPVDETIFAGMAYRYLERDGTGYITNTPNCAFCGHCEVTSAAISLVLQDHSTLYSSSSAWQSMLAESSPAARFYNRAGLHIPPIERKPWPSSSLGATNFLREVDVAATKITQGRADGTIIDASNNAADGHHHWNCKLVLTPTRTLLLLTDARMYYDFVESWERHLRSETGPSSKSKRK